MKRILLLVFPLVISLTVSAREVETWMFLGPEFSFAWESQGSSSDELKSTMNSLGLNLSSFAFRDRNDIGFYVHDSFLFPQSSTLSYGGETVDVDLSVYDFLMTIEITLGPGFRVKRNENSYLLYGFGLHLMQMSGFYDTYEYGYGSISYEMLAYNLGVGGDIAVKFDISDSSFFIVGASGSYDPFDFSTVTVNGETESGRAVNYSYFAIHPYIGMGFNLYQSRAGFGKP